MNEALLYAGLALGVILAALGLAAPSETMPEGPDAGAVVAEVNHEPIYAADYQRALAALQAQRRDGRLSAEDRATVLEGLVDEALLVQHGLALGLATRDARVRSDLAAATLALVSASAENEAVTDEAALRALHAQEAARWRKPEQLAVSVWRASPEGRAPDERYPLAPVTVLEGQLGPTLLQAAQAAGAAPVSVALPDATAWLRVDVRVPGEAPDFEAVRAQVEALHRRRVGEAALRRFLEEARRSARIERRVEGS